MLRELRGVAGLGCDLRGEAEERLKRLVATAGALWRSDAAGLWDELVGVPCCTRSLRGEGLCCWLAGLSLVPSSAMGATEDLAGCATRSSAVL